MRRGYVASLQRLTARAVELGVAGRVSDRAFTLAFQHVARAGLEDGEERVATWILENERAPSEVERRALLQLV